MVATVRMLRRLHGFSVTCIQTMVLQILLAICSLSTMFQGVLQDAAASDLFG